MFSTEAYNQNTATNDKASVLKLIPNERIRNITLTGIFEGEGEYGLYTIAFFKTEDGKKGVLQLSPKLQEAFVQQTASGAILKPEFKGLRIWIGKKSFEADGQEKTVLEYGVE
ncbi:MAG: hypothetical protein PHU61_04620 [Candidatus Absconditabacteria bacterium]|nr:hypothetical protein [Candidatus Absconditabacteria bacterium]